MTQYHIYTHDPAYGETMMRYTSDDLIEMFGAQSAAALREGRPVQQRGMTWINAAHAARTVLRAPSLQDAIAATTAPCVDIEQPHGRDVITAWTERHIRDNTHACAIIAWLLSRCGYTGRN